MIQLVLLAALKVVDSLTATGKQILVQRGRLIPAGFMACLTSFTGLYITKLVVTDKGWLTMIVSSAFTGVGCCIAVGISSRLSRDRTYVNVVMSDDLAAMQAFRDFLAMHHITNVATDSYTRSWDRKTITVTAYAETRAQSTLIDRYLEESAHKYKRVIQKG